jgi:hypothetical protein
MIKEAPGIMKGWSSSKTASPENAVAVESLVKRLIDEHRAGNNNAVPTTFEYNCMLEVWSKSGAGAFAAERCEQILAEMEERYQAGDSNVQPNLSSFKPVLMAWRHVDESYSSYRAQRVLEWMVRIYQDGQNDLALPDSDCFDIVLQSWSRSGDKQASRNAEKLLGFMEKFSRETDSPKLEPRTTSFNAVLGAWSRSTSKDHSWKRVCDIFGFMEHLYYDQGNERVQPDAATYSIVLGALARSGDEKAAPKADSILKRLEKEYKAGNIAWKPDTILFNSAMGCWTKSKASRAYRCARSVLDRQRNLYESGCEDCKPDIFGFTSVLSSCASEPGDRRERAKAFNVALATFQELELRSDEFGSPNHVTYGTMIKACARLLPYGSALRQKWTRKLFAECAVRGQVGDMVLSRLREAATPEEYREMTQGHSRSNIPSKWSRNVVNENNYRRKVVENRNRAKV